MVAVDHFQHLVYAEPSCSADDRAKMWQEMERIYLPLLKLGRLGPSGERATLASPDAYLPTPFYYIDYAWHSPVPCSFGSGGGGSRRRHGKGMASSCRRGGAAPFGELVKSAGLTSPFEAGCLERVVEHAHRELIQAL